MWRARVEQAASRTIVYILLLLNWFIAFAVESHSNQNNIEHSVCFSDPKTSSLNSNSTNHETCEERWKLVEDKAAVSYECVTHTTDRISSVCNSNTYQKWRCGKRLDTSDAHGLCYAACDKDNSLVWAHIHRHQASGWRPHEHTMLRRNYKWEPTNADTWFSSTEMMMAMMLATTTDCRSWFIMYMNIYIYEYTIYISTESGIIANCAVKYARGIGFSCLKSPLFPHFNVGPSKSWMTQLLRPNNMLSSQCSRQKRSFRIESLGAVSFAVFSILSSSWARHGRHESNVLQTRCREIKSPNSDTKSSYAIYFIFIRRVSVHSPVPMTVLC